MRMIFFSLFLSLSVLTEDNKDIFFPVKHHFFSLLLTLRQLSDSEPGYGRVLFGDAGHVETIVTIQERLVWYFAHCLLVFLELGELPVS